MEDTLDKFSLVLDQINYLRRPTGKITQLDKFAAVTEEFKSLNTKDFFGSSIGRHLFPGILSDLQKLITEVYTERKQTTSQLIEDNPDKLRLSCFELIEHNFRENTHSNIHQYIFDYHFLGKTGPELLTSFLGDGSPIPDLRCKLLKQQYKLSREHSTGTGRIDLMIIDPVNKFVIVVENKILAEVSIRDVETKRTQLNDYHEYIQKHYKGYDSDFILLTFLTMTEDYIPYRHKSYERLYEIVEKTESNDNILYHYKLLLQSLQHGLNDKPKRARQAMSIINNELLKPLPLNNLELLNRIFL